MRKGIGMLGWALLCASLQAQTARTVLDGVYTDAQAARGQVAYQTNCSMCHRESLDGGAEALPLRGEHFLESWRDDSLAPLFDHMRTRMPRRPGGEPGSLSENTYIDILAYILKVSEYPSGSGELTKDAVGSIQLVGKDGPKPLATNALVQVIGCFAAGPGNTWILNNASDPARTRNAEEITTEERKAGADKALGTEKFRLQNLPDFRANFMPDDYKGHKVAAKGSLIRQTNNDRIYVLALETVAGTCSGGK
jgi:S-disulfanyl-L-cysteine oxidoreductase SoxD